MNKTTINVPPGIRYISEWEEFQLPEQPCIIDKQITGCGFTEWCITGNFNAIIASPRLILLENKEDQHRGEVFYARNDLDVVLNVDRDLTKALSTVKKSEEEQEKLKIGVNTDIKKSELRQKIKKYFIQCLDEDVPCKILVTYDSYRIVYEALIEIGCFDSFYTVVDEFQSIFTDSRFKSDTELEFLSILEDVQRLCFVSATPAVDKYLEMLDEFKNLPYYELRWDTLDSNRLINPQLEIHPCKRLTDMAVKIIQSYLCGNFEKTGVENIDTGYFYEVESRELVIYVNSVKNICDIIRKAGLTYSNTNVLCSNTSSNQKKVRSAFGLSRGQEGGIGKVPLRDEPRKMFTLCTRTVYLGADFYSTCARSIILSDANIDCLAVDITLDLPQILGRQRLDENPWKNRAELYAKFLSESNIKDFDKFIEYIKNKTRKTNELLEVYSNVVNKSTKYTLAETYQYVANSKNYRDNYVAVNVHNGRDLVPIFNNLVMVSEIRAFEIQQVDFANRFRTFAAVNSTGKIDINDTSTNEVSNFIIMFNHYTQYTQKMKYLCESNLSEKALILVLAQLPLEYSSYFNILGKERIKSLGYKKGELEKACKKVLEGQTGGEVEKLILNNFNLGDRITLFDAKEKLKLLYKENNIQFSPKARTLEDYFEVKKTRVKNSEGKFVDGYEILKIKDLNG